MEALPAGQAQQGGKPAPQPEPATRIERRHVDVIHVVKNRAIRQPRQKLRAEPLVNGNTVQIQAGGGKRDGRGGYHQGRGRKIGHQHGEPHAPSGGRPSQPEISQNTNDDQHHDSGAGRDRPRHQRPPKSWEVGLLQHKPTQQREQRAAHPSPQDRGDGRAIREHVFGERHFSCRDGKLHRVPIGYLCHAFQFGIRCNKLDG